jgi:hypothetical protein
MGRRGGGRERQTAYITSAVSGVPKVGAPDCMSIVETNAPSTAGAPGFTSCENAMPTIDSASTWVHTAAGVTGAMAPARMNGVNTEAWLCLA